MNSARPSAAFYARVSSDQQAKDQTIDSQIELIKGRLNADGFDCPDSLAFIDDGHSGSTMRRPALERLRDRVAAGAIERLYVLAPDRLARRYAYQVLLLDEFRRASVEVIFLNRPIGQSPEDDLLLQVQGMIAEYERAKILERSRRGRLHAARRGSVSVLHCAPFGYRYVPASRADGEAQMIIDEPQAEVVRRIFTWVANEQCSLGEVVRRLEREGVASPQGKSRWSRSTVAALLNNSTYRGVADYGKTRRREPQERLRPSRGQPEHPKRPESRTATPVEDRIAIPVPAIIGDDQFTRVAEQLADNRRRHRLGQRGVKYLLQGIIECVHCGHAFYGKISTSVYKGRRSNYTYYRCIGCEPYRNGGEKLCHNRQVRTDLLESAVWNDLVSWLSDPQRLEEEARRRLEEPTTAGADRTRTEEELRRTRLGLSRVMDAFENGLIDKSEFETRMKRLKTRLQEAEKRLMELTQAEAKRSQIADVLAQWNQFAERVKAGIAEADWSTKRSIIRSLIKRVKVDHEQIRIVYRVPPQRFSASNDSDSLQDCPDHAHSSHPTK